MLTFIIFFSLLGLIVGSFLNVVILRYNTGKSLSGRSGCFSCRHKLSWYELVPVMSFLLQKGRCRHCRSKISIQYPAVEILTGVLFALAAWKFYPNPFAILFYCILMALLVIIVVYDLRHKIIADKPTYLFIVLSLFAPLFSGAGAESSSGLGWVTLTHLVGGFVIFLFFFSLWYFSAGRWMGFGDAKLGFAIGLLLGFWGALNAVVLAFWAVAVVGLILILISRMKKMIARRWRFSVKSEVPFAPFLALGLVLNLFWGLAIFVF